MSPNSFGPFVVDGSASLPDGIDIQVYEDGIDVTGKCYITAKKSVVTARFTGKKKVQRVLKSGLITEDMLNDEKDGVRVCKIQGKGWEPTGPVGGLIVYDADCPEDTWIIASEAQTGGTGEDYFNELGYEATGEEIDGNAVYAKNLDKIPTTAGFTLPPGWTVETLEGPIPTDGVAVLACPKPVKGDWVLWPSRLVDAGCIVDVE